MSVTENDRVQTLIIYPLQCTAANHVTVRVSGVCQGGLVSLCVCRGIIASLGGRNTQRSRALLEALTHVSSVLATSSRLYLTRGRCVCLYVIVIRSV